MDTQPILFQFSTPLYDDRHELLFGSIPKGFAQKVRELCPGVVDCFVYSKLVIVIYDVNLVKNETYIDDPFIEQVIPWALKQSKMFPQKSTAAQPIVWRYFGE